MAKLVYSAIASLDGYVADKDGNFDWAAPDEEVHASVNDLERPAGTYLYGRRMYETMLYWETVHTIADQPYFVSDPAEIWQAAEKVVYSKELQAVSSVRTRIERYFAPGVVRQIKDAASRDITVSGADLAAQAIAAGLVDELHVLVTPVIMGGGKPFLPSDVRLHLELLNVRRFASGMVYLHYDAAARASGLGGARTRKAGSALLHDQLLGDLGVGQTPCHGVHQIFVNSSVTLKLWVRPCSRGSAEREGITGATSKLDPDCFLLQVLVDCPKTVLPPDAGLLDPAEGHARRNDSIGVDPDASSPQPCCHPMGTSNVLSPYGPGEPVWRIVRQLNGLVLVLEAYGGENWTEYFLSIDG
jgi:dihydrofolate reductase